MKISVIITNWNGLETIKESLPQIIKNSPEAHEFVVGDDGSTDASLEYLKSLQKKDNRIKLVTHQHNQGFISISNDTVAVSQGDFVVLLNNDIFPHPKYIAKAIPHFKDKNVFGVGLAETQHPNWSQFYWQGGYLQFIPGTDIKSTHISGWISGGSSIVRKEYFNKLKGFDPIFSPGYFEDVDLGYRAWKSGYQLLWEPTAIVDHNHGNTFSKLPRHYINYVKERNHLLTVWRNISDPQLINQHRLAMVGRVLFGPNYIKIIKAAIQQINRNPQSVVFPQLTDQQILSKFKN